VVFWHRKSTKRWAILSILAMGLTWTGLEPAESVSARAPVDQNGHVQRKLMYFFAEKPWSMLEMLGKK